MNRSPISLEEMALDMAYAADVACCIALGEYVPSSELSDAVNSIMRDTYQGNVTPRHALNHYEWYNRRDRALIRLYKLSSAAHSLMHAIMDNNPMPREGE